MSYENNNLENSVNENNNTTEIENNSSKTPQKTASSIVIEIIFSIIACGLLYGFYLRHSSESYQGSLKFSSLPQFIIFVTVVILIQIFFDKMKSKKK